MVMMDLLEIQAIKSNQIILSPSPAPELEMKLSLILGYTQNLGERIDMLSYYLILQQSIAS